MRPAPHRTWPQNSRSVPSEKQWWTQSCPLVLEQMRENRMITNQQQRNSMFTLSDACHLWIFSSFFCMFQSNYCNYEHFIQTLWLYCYGIKVTRKDSRPCGAPVSCGTHSTTPDLEGLPHDPGQDMPLITDQTRPASRSFQPCCWPCPQHSLGKVTYGSAIQGPG